MNKTNHKRQRFSNKTLEKGNNRRSKNESGEEWSEKKE